MLNLFRASGKKGASSIFLWIVVIAAIIGLGGYSLVTVATGLAGQNVATVGSQGVATNDFIRALDSSLRQTSRRLGISLSMSQARAIGLDQQVLGQLVTQGALDHQTDLLELSAGDIAVRDALLERPEFFGASGVFDELAYDLRLGNSGLRTRDYEERVRADLARTLLEAGVSGGIEMPEIIARTIMSHIGERRSYAYTVVPQDRIGEIEAPSDADLSSYFDAHKDEYLTEEIRKVSLVTLQSDEIIAAMDITAEEFKAAYDDNIAAYELPERRLVDRIVFPDIELAAEALDRIEAGEASFEEIGAERDLTPAELEVGELRQTGLPTAISEAVFGHQDLGVVGPVETDLGPALYRINAILAAQTTSLEDATDELRAQIGSRRFGQVIAEAYGPVQDLLAQGAPLDEIADTTDMVLTKLEISESGGEGLAAIAAVRSHAADQDVGEDAVLFDLPGGGIGALVVDEIQPPAVPKLAEITEVIAADWTDQAEQEALMAEAERVVGLLADGKTFATVVEAETLELVEGETPLRRGDAVDALPPNATDILFEMTQGETRILQDAQGTFALNLVEIIAYDPDSEENADEFNAVQGRISNDTARDIFYSFTQGAQNEAGVSINQTLIDQTLAHYP